MKWEEIFYKIIKELGIRHDDGVDIFLGYSSHRKTFHTMKLDRKRENYSLDCRVKPFPKSIKYVQI